MLSEYVRPNDLEFDEDFWTYDFMSVILKSLGMLPLLLNQLNYLKRFVMWLVIGIRDDTGALADAILDKYLEGFPLGDMMTMIPGLIDVKSCISHV
jgi:hypothetical protein